MVLTAVASIALLPPRPGNKARTGIKRLCQHNLVLDRGLTRRRSKTLRGLDYVTPALEAELKEALGPASGFSGPSGGVEHW